MIPRLPPPGLTHRRNHEPAHRGGYREAATPSVQEPLWIRYDAPRASFLLEFVCLAASVALCLYAYVSRDYWVFSAAATLWVFIFWRIQTPSHSSVIALDDTSLKVSHTHLSAPRAIPTAELAEATMLFSTRPGFLWEVGVESRAHEEAVSLMPVSNEAAAEYICAAINDWLGEDD